MRPATPVRDARIASGPNIEKQFLRTCVFRYVLIILAFTSNPASADYIRVIEQEEGKCEVPKGLKPIQKLNGYTLYLLSAHGADSPPTVFVKKAFRKCVLSFRIKPPNGAKVDYSSTPITLWETYHPTAPYGRFNQVISDHYEQTVKPCKSHGRCDTRFQRLLRRSVGVRLRYTFNETELSDWAGFVMGSKGWHSERFTPKIAP